MHMTGFGPEFESVIVATIMFLAGGAVSFFCCFCITNGYIWHKRRIYRRRLKHEWSEGTESTGGGSTIDIIKQYPQRGVLRKQTSLDQQSQLKRVIVVDENGRKTISKSNNKNIKEQQRRNTNVVFECGNSLSTEETNSS
ncbi:hypothetical protein Mgra_00001499 [Meloidogyne graminicola]|uniref:Uncharacterized protein n=1 Tax=Meloidogyne graminicola TaxID=189291 RepID=A0A8T0A1J4_9BILA|nr:hypothetical protein Mgra_00001499 [Meloidogyne graminicola]